MRIDRKTVLAVAVASLVACGSKESPRPPASTDAGKPPANLTTMVLTPRTGACTEMACSDDNPCCNSCANQGWWPPDAATAFTKVSVAPGVQGLPTDVALDGCARAPFAIEAQVATTGSAIVVHAWKQVPFPCELRLETLAGGADRATLQGSAEVKLEAWAVNQAGRDLSFTIVDNCPGLDARFRGFGGISLYDRSCMAGACDPGAATVRTLAVPSGGRVLIDQTTLRTKMPCEDAPVPAAAYPIEYELGFVGRGPITCSTPATVTVP